MKSESESKTADVSSLRSGKWSEKPEDMDEPEFNLERAMAKNEESEKENPPSEPDDEKKDDEDDTDA